MTFTSSLLLALAVATGPVPGVPETPVVQPARVSLAQAAKVMPVRATAGPASEAWTLDRREGRPSALPVMYAALGALNALDAYSTRRSIGSGAVEANPLMQKPAGSAGTMLAVKAISTAGTIFFAERAWKKNRKGAVVMMALINGTMAAITARNFRNSTR